MMKQLFLSLLVAGSLGVVSHAALAENVVRWATDADIPTLDPDAYASTKALTFQNHIYESLVQRDNDLKIQPWLALSWQQIDDTTLRFKLREGVKFHNGDELTSEDVVASVARVTDPASGIRANASTIKDAVAVDKYTVDIHLVKKTGIAINELTGVMIMDKKWLSEHNALKPTDISQGTEGYATNNTNGTGPFILQSRQRDTQMVLVRNPDWWNAAAGTTNIDKIIFKPISSDATRLSGLLAGEYDLVTSVPLQDIQRLQNNPAVQLQVSPSLRVDYLALNMRDTLNAKNAKAENPLKDIRVRQSLYMAINREAITQKVMRGLTKQTNNYLAPDIPGYDAKAGVDYPYDPAKAKALLAEAGYPQGFNLNFDCPEGTYINAPQWCQAVQSYWSKIGVKAALNVHPASVYDPILVNGRTDVGVLGWANLPIMDPYSVAVQLLHTSNGKSLGTFNIPRYSNPAADKLIDDSVGELDNTKRIAMLSQAVALANKDLPYLPMHFEPTVWAMSKKLTLKQTPDNVQRLWYGKVSN